MFGVLRTDVSAEDGTFWEYIDDTHTLRIYGTGVIPNYVTNDDAPWYKHKDSITKIVIEEGVTEIGNHAFSYSSVKFVEIPDTVTRIGKEAFYKCLSLVSVSVPDSVKKIYDGAFSECTSLTAADISGIDLKLPQLGVFNRCPLTHVHIPKEIPTAYFTGISGLPTDESCYFRIGSDGKCPAAVCPFREGVGAVGDVNGDGKLNNTDIILLGRAYMAGDAAKYLSVADMNNDGRITNADIILLGRLYMTGK